MDLTVISVNYNDALGLAITRESLQHLASEELSFEWIVIDGGSSDGSVHEAQKPVSGAARVVVVTEPDDGIYDAMNKGLKLAEGRYLIFMNSADYFLPRAGSLIKEFFSEGPEGLSVKVFGIRTVRDGCRVRTRTFSSADELKKFPATPHQSTLIRTEDAIAIGGYDLSFHLLADYDFFCRLHLAGKSFDYRDRRHLSVFQQDGASSMPKNQALMAKEASTIQVRHFGRANWSYGTTLHFKSLILRLPLSKHIDKFLRNLMFGR